MLCNYWENKIKNLPYLIFLCIFLHFHACSLMQKLGERSSPGIDRQGGLLADSGFEEGGKWIVSAPPGFTEYASLDFDRKIKHSGRQSAHVFIRRHPRNDNLEILHAWQQDAGAIKAGARIKFGGWVRAEAGTTIKLSLKCEFEKPVNGNRFVTIFAEQPQKTGSFRYVEKVIVLPTTTATFLTIHAGLSSIGEAWFDDLFIKVLRN
jgi:hypothetical protein